LINLDDVFILDHTYNATINAVTKACESLVNYRKFSQNLVLVLGSIEGLGETATDVHFNLGYYISALPIDMVITVGDEARFVGDGIRHINHNKKIVEHCSSPAELPEKVLQKLSPHTTVLMMGGKSLQLGTRLKDLTRLIRAR
ncbi:MAG: hypothetical protein WAN36_07370, partial [Calditrichia bacterium]